MKLILSNGERIPLPSEFAYEERKSLVDKIIETYPDDFSYSEDEMLSKRYGRCYDNDHLAKIRLDILSTYLIQSEEDYTEDVMSAYKKRVRPKQEKPFSEFHRTTIEANGWY